MTQRPYRVSAPKPDPYLAAWARLRRRRAIRRVAAAFVGYSLATVIAVATKTAQRTPGARVQALGENYLMLGSGVAFGIVLLGLTAALARYLVPFLCPRCAQPFFRGPAMELGFARTCVNCGIAVNTPRLNSDAGEGASS